MDIDWTKIKAEYIAGGTSYRKLAEKYKDEGVTFNTLKVVAHNEKWADLRKRTMDKATTRLVNKVANDVAKNSIQINDVADKLLSKIGKLLDDYDELDTQAIKHLTSSIKDLKDIKGIKSDLDVKEQEARIDKLRKDAMEEQTDKEIELVMGEEVDSYAN